MKTRLNPRSDGLPISARMRQRTLQSDVVRVPHASQALAAPGMTFSTTPFKGGPLRVPSCGPGPARRACGLSEPTRRAGQTPGAYTDAAVGSRRAQLNDAQLAQGVWV